MATKNEELQKARSNPKAPHNQPFNISKPNKSSKVKGKQMGKKK